MHRYTECGLPNVRLSNGYTVHKTAQGKGVAIENVAGLHVVIGKTLATKSRLTGAELRFLRKEMDWSQRALAAFVGTSEQNVSLWERHGKVPAAAARLVQLVYMEHVDGNVSIRSAVEKVAEIDRRIAESMMFEQRGQRWMKAA